jgi:PA-IL-like protein
MYRRLISAVALVAVVGVYASAAEQATFILNNGERRNGELSASGPEAANFVNGRLTLSGQQVPIDQVAVIDLAGGTPSATELSRVPKSSAQAVVMRSGHAQAGKFVNIVRGDTLLWENDKGQQEQYPLRDVSRIYLHSQNARTAYNAPASQGAPAAATPAPAGTSGQTPGQPGGVRVHANVAWNDTGIRVKSGEMVTFRTSGQIQFGESQGQTASPDGNPTAKSPNYPVSAVGAGALIGKVGNSAPFAIGSNSAPIRMPADGRLLLGVNDNEINDNSGYFSVVISK